VHSLRQTFSVYQLFSSTVNLFYQPFSSSKATIIIFVFQLEEVMEKETYKAAKDLLDKYDPNSEIVKVLNESFIINFIKKLCAL